MDIERFSEWIEGLYYRRTPSDSVIFDNVILIGAGGAGTWFAIIYSMHLTAGSKIVIVDNDVLETHNLNRLPYPIVFGTSKVKKGKVLVDFIKLLRPWVQAVFVDKRIETETDLEDLLAFVVPTMVVDASDNIVTIKLIKNFARLRDIKYLGLHYDGFDITIEYIAKWYGVQEDWIVDSNASGYRIFPSTPIPSAILGALGARLAIIRPDYNILIKTNVDQLLNNMNIFIKRCEGDGR